MYLALAWFCVSNYEFHEDTVYQCPRMKYLKTLYLGIEHEIYKRKALLNNIIQ